MRMIIQVAKSELRNLFYSPVAWFLLVAFFVQCAWFYTDPLGIIANWQDISNKNNPEFTEWPNSSLTRNLFLGDEGFFSNVLQNLYLFIPLLTMGLIGREVQDGTIKLLYSSPVKIRQIVTGKFLAIIIFNVLLSVIIGLFFIAATWHIRSVDYGMLVSALLGFFLLASAYAAIGTFMSSLTIYQIISALGTFFIVLTLTLIGNVWQQYDLIRDITYFLFLSGRTERMLNGLITSKDVIYFLVVIIMFLSLTILKLRGTRESLPWYISAGRYLGVVVIALMAGYISSRPAVTGYWDTTQQKVNTINYKTQQLIHEIGKEPLEVTLFTNYLGGGGGNGIPEARNKYLSRLWEPYTRFKPDIIFNYEYYYDYDSTIMGDYYSKTFPGKSVDQIAQKMAKERDFDLSDFQTPGEMRKKIDLRPENLRLVMQLKYKGRTEFLRTFDDSQFWPDEYMVAAVLKKLLHPEKIPVAYFINGHYERNIYKSGEREFKGHTTGKDSRISLLNYGFEVDTIAIENEDFPVNTDLVVLADPKAKLSEKSMAKISNYISQGGNMFIMGEPCKQEIINPVLRPLGVYLDDGIILTPSMHEAQDMVIAPLDSAMLQLMKDSAVPVVSEYFKRPLLIPGVAAVQALDSGDFTINTLYKTEKRTTWLRRAPFVRDSAKVHFQDAEGDLRSTGDGFAALVSLQRNVGTKDQRIIVAGDADFLSNLRSPRSIRVSRYLYSWLNNGEFPIFVMRAEPPDNWLLITADSAKFFTVIFLYVLPAAILLFAAILLTRRKRK